MRREDEEEAVGDLSKCDAVGRYDVQLLKSAELRSRLLDHMQRWYCLPQ